MVPSRLAAIATGAAVLVSVTACGGSSGNTSRPASTAGSITPGARASGPTSEVPSFVNGGSALADTSALVYVLEAVNPGIGSNKNDLVAKSKTLCAHVKANESESQLEADAATGFTNGSWVPSEPEAQAIVGTVKAYGGC